MARSCPTACVGETAPHQEDFLSGAPCLAGCGGGDGELCFTRGPQQINSSEHPRCPPGLAGLYTQIKPKRFPPCTAACPPGVLLPAALCLFFVEPSAASSCFQMFPSGCHPGWLLSSKYWGQKTPLLLAQGCVGYTTAHLYHPVKCSSAAGRKDRLRLV